MPVDQLEAEKRLEVLLSTRTEEARRSSRCNVCFLGGNATGGWVFLPGGEGEEKDVPVGAMQVRNSELSALLNSVSTCSYEGY